LKSFQRANCRQSHAAHISNSPCCVLRHDRACLQRLTLHCLPLLTAQDAPSDIRLSRRLSRDVRERGRSVDSVLRQYEDTVRPMHEQWVEPTKYQADLVVNNMLQHSMDTAVEILCNHLSVKGGV
jgi:uridine kinase